MEVPMQTLSSPKNEYSSPTTMIINKNNNGDDEKLKITKKSLGKPYMILLGINYICLFLGSVSSSLLSKFYFNHKGSSRWLSTWVQTAGFPFLIIPIYLPYYLKLTQRPPFSHFTPRIFVLSIVIGLLLGVNNFLFSWGNSYLPMSTSAILLSSQLMFNLILSVIIVKTKLSFQNVNCVVLLTLSSVLVGLGSSHDKPKGLTSFKYFIGFACTIGAGLMFALYLPVMEMIYRKVYCYAMVVEMQFVMEIAATVLATIGMASCGGLKEIKRDIHVYDLGKSAYWWTVASNVVTWQLCFMGTAGMVFLTTSVTGGICTTALLGINVVAGVLVLGDNFGGVKAISTLLCAWGFCSYVYGMYEKMKQEGERERVDEEISEMTQFV